MDTHAAKKYINIKVSNIPVSIRRCFDVYTTFITLKRRHMDVKATSCAHWDCTPSLFLKGFFFLNCVKGLLYILPRDE